MSTTKHSYSLKSRRLTRILKERTLLLYEYLFALWPLLLQVHPDGAQ